MDLDTSHTESNSALRVNSDTKEINLHSLEQKVIQENGNEMNINHFETDHSLLDSDDNEENNESESIVVQSPFIKITKSATNEETVLRSGKILNDLNSRRGRTANNEGGKRILSKSKHKSNSRSPTRESKVKNKIKSKDHSVRIKTKFTPSQIDYISKQLKDVIFSAWIGEREYVEKLRDYRDIIEVDEWEDNLNQRLKTVMFGVRGVMEGTKWINITVPSSISCCYCLWVLLEDAPRPGHYWMQITSVKLDPQFGLKISVKILREIHAFDGESKFEREKRLEGEMTPDEWREWVVSVTSLNIKALWINIMGVITPTNISSGIRLFIVLIVTLVVAFTTLLQHSWEFLLRLLREFGIFVHHTTPFAQSVIGCFEKIIGGFYLLIAMVYRDLRQPKGPPPTSRPSPPGGRPFLCPPETPRALTYVPPQAWVFNRDDSD